MMVESLNGPSLQTRYHSTNARQMTSGHRGMWRNRGRSISMQTKWVYRFEEVRAAQGAAGSWDGVRSLLGGKGANLAEMTRIGLPVPPGFTITTKACNAYLKKGNRLPTALWSQVLAALTAVEKKTAKRFGDPHRPLLVSCR